MRNPAADQATFIVVSGRLFDDTGAQIGKGEAVLTSTVLPAGASGGFAADFPDLFSFAAAKFEARSLSLATQPGPPSQIPSKDGG